MVNIWHELGFESADHYIDACRWVEGGVVCNLPFRHEGEHAHVTLRDGKSSAGP